MSSKEREMLANWKLGDLNTLSLLPQVACVPVRSCVASLLPSLVLNRSSNIC